MKNEEFQLWGWRYKIDKCIVDENMYFVNRVLMPKFSLSQDKNYVHIKIKEITINGKGFTFKTIIHDDGL